MAGLLLVIAVWQWRSFGAPAGGDYAQYLAHAQALVDGRAYDDTGYLYTPFYWLLGPPRQPPGTPLTLVPVLALFGPGETAPRVVMHLLLAVMLGLSWRVLRREATPSLGNTDASRLATGAILLAGTSLVLQGAPNVVGADLGMSAALWATLAVAGAGAAAGPGLGWGRVAMLALVGAVAILYRVAAVPLIPAVVTWVALSWWGGRARREGHATLRPLLPALAWALTFYAVFVVFGAGATPRGPLALGSGADRSLAQSFLGMLPLHARHYGYGVMDLQLYPFPWGRANQLYHLVAIGLTGVGLLAWLRRARTSFLAHFSVFYGAMLIAAPVSSGRYLWPLYPVLAMALLQGSVIALAWVGRGLGRGPREPRVREDPASKSSPRAVRSVLVAVAVVAAGACFRTAAIPNATAGVSTGDHWGEAGERLRLDGGDEVRAGSNRPRRLAWHGGVPSMPLIPIDRELAFSEMRDRGVRYVVFDRSSVTDLASADWDEWVLDDRRLEHLTDVGPIGIWRIRDPSEPEP